MIRILFLKKNKRTNIFIVAKLFGNCLVSKYGRYQYTSTKK